MTEPQPLVSVCVPSYNRAERLRRAVGSVLRSSYDNVEIIISDNCSTDHTPAVCEELARLSPKVRFIRQPVNQGATNNFVFVWQQARGKYFLWLADDDYLDPDYILRCVEALEGDPGLSLAAGLGAYHPGDGVTRFRGNVVQASSRWRFWRLLRYTFLVEDNSMVYGMYRREMVRDCRMPNCLGGDAIWVAEVLLAGRGRILPSTFVHREASDNTSATPAKIAAVLGFARWQGDYPWLAMPWNLARGIAFESYAYRDRNIVLCLAVFASVFSVSFLKQAIQAVLRRLPQGRQLYKRLFSSEAGI